jgi:hypothetical protein
MNTAPVSDVQGLCTVARVYADGPRSFRRAARSGTCDVFVSVGTLDGTPHIALPLDQEDGQRRYRIGTVEMPEL